MHLKRLHISIKNLPVTPEVHITKNKLCSKPTQTLCCAPVSPRRQKSSPWSPQRLAAQSDESVGRDEQDETVPALLEVGPAQVRPALHRHALRLAAHVQLHGRAAHAHRQFGSADPGRQEVMLLVY